MKTIELIKEAKTVLTEDEIAKTENEEISIGDDIRNKLTNKVCWFYPSVDNFNTILSYVKNANKVLDVGCGSAIVGKYILDKYPNIEYKGIRLSMYKIDLFKYVPDHLIEEFSSKDKHKVNEILSTTDYDTWLLIYPPYNKPLAYEALTRFIDNPNAKTLIYVGEREGCTGDDSFNSLLDKITYEGYDNLIAEENFLDTYKGMYDVIIKITKGV